MKRFVILLTVIVLFSPLLSASKLFSLGFGSITQFQEEFSVPGLQQATFIDVNNWATGVEARLKLLGINLDANMLIQQGEIVEITEEGRAVFADDIAQKLFGLIAIGFSSKSSPFTTFSLGVGPQWGANISKEFAFEFWVGSPDNIFRGDWNQFLSDMSLSYRARIDLNIKKLSLGVFYQVPTNGFSVNQCQLTNLSPLWSEGRVGASMIMGLF